MKTLPRILNTQKIAKSRLFTVEAVDLQFSNGEKRTFERLARRHHGAVMIVPISENREFVLIREYAVGVEQYELTFPKGFIDPGESALQAADREIKGRNWLWNSKDSFVNKFSNFACLYGQSIYASFSRKSLP